jgi:hypothetical protein
VTHRALVRTQTEAKRFFADRVVRRAQVEGVSLSEAERHMLLWSESDPDFTPDLALVEALTNQTSDEDYEAKIAGLLTRSFAEDVAADRTAPDLWRHVISVLNQGDHYIAIMIGQSIGPKLKPWWRFW